MSERVGPQSEGLGAISPLSRSVDIATMAKAIEASGIGMIITDTAGDRPILYANAAFLRMTGYERDEVLGRNCRFLQGPETSKETIREIGDALQQQREVSVELINYRKDGSAFWNLLHVCPIHDDDGKPAFFFGYQRDISLRKETAEALQQALRLEALGKLTGGVAHDYNNLLQVIQTSLEVIELSVASHQDIARRTAGTLVNCRRAIDRASMLTRQLMVFARRQKFSSTPIDINQLFERLRSVLTQALGEEVQVQLHLEPALWHCSADPAQVEPIIVNIAINSRDAMKGAADQRLEISTFNRELSKEEAALRSVEAGRYVEIVIADNGPGIPQGILNRVLDPFFTTKTEGKGVGLGLSVAYGFARQSGGTLYIGSKEGMGTSIHILLPYTDAPLGMSSPPASEQKVTLPASQPHILLVEDRVDVASTTRHMLELLGYDVTVANDADSALQVLAQVPAFDLLLSDVVMPGAMDGIALARKAAGQYPHLQVLLVTGYADIGEQGDLEFPVLSKPYQQADLSRALRDILFRNAGARSVS
ncbi:PAS domain-containing protein [Dyella jejuensis]|uniref:histidine kinase n=1 Tax=Dyella jejuensis TaxID=1432009 RepID=A0ABW8JL56_9GAMM